MINNFQLKLTITLSFLFFTVIDSFAASVYEPNSNLNITSLAEWQDPSNWTCVSGDCTTGYPLSDDTVEFGNTATNCCSYSITINFDLASTYTGLSFSSTANDSELTFGANAVIDADYLIENNKSTISILEGGSVVVNNDFVTDNNATSLSVCGNLTVSGNMTIGGGNTVTVCENGNLYVDGNFKSIGSDLNVYGRFEATDYGDFADNGALSNLNVYSTGYAKFNGDLFVDNTNIDVDQSGILEVVGQVSYTSTANNPTWSIEGYLVIHEGIDIHCDKSFLVDIVASDKGGLIIDQEKAGDNECDPKGVKADANYDCSMKLFCDDINSDLYTPTTPPDLPIHLLYYSGSSLQEGVLLSWATANEENSSHFTIESSYDKSSWIEEETQDAAGNSNVRIEYQQYISNPNGEYFRLAQYDYDGTVTYYGPIQIKNNPSFNDQSLLLFPTFLKNGDHLSLLSSNPFGEIDGTYSIYDIQGNHMQTKDITLEEGGSIQTINLENDQLSSGLYLMKLNYGSQKKTFKFFVE